MTIPTYRDTISGFLILKEVYPKDL